MMACQSAERQSSKKEAEERASNQSPAMTKATKGKSSENKNSS
jgi:hypothetical protein